MNCLQLLLAAIWLASLVVPTAQECKEAYKKRPTHTACQMPNKDCEIHNRTVSAEDRELLLKLHNDYRSQVAKGKLEGYPPAENMIELLWDDELADVAQALADQCTEAGGDINHDNPADRFTTKFKRTGQNIAWDASKDPVSPKWTARVKSWFDEYPDFDAANIKRFEGGGKTKKFGHFTQLVWAKTRYVGCGFVYYSLPGAKYRHQRLYVCNYGPSGNVLTLPMYKEGETCGSCSNGTKCDNATGLCTPSGGTNSSNSNTTKTTSATTKTTNATTASTPNATLSPPSPTETSTHSLPPTPKRSSGSAVVPTLPWLNLCVTAGVIIAQLLLNFLYSG